MRCFTIPKTIFSTSEMVSNIVNLFKFQSMLEIGVAGGGLSKHVSMIPSLNFYIGLDPYIDGNDNVEYNQGSNKTSAIGIFSKMNGSILISNTIDSILGGVFDFIYIDGDHSYDGIKHDYETTQERLKYKLIGGHDFKLGTGVLKYIPEVVSDENLVVIYDKSSNHWLDMKFLSRENKKKLVCFLELTEKNINKNKDN